jgi:FtsZ-interacting cell division protein ZipA
MNEKVRSIIIVICIAIIAVILSGFIFWNIGRANSPNNATTGGFEQRARNLLNGIGEYQQRDQEYIERERTRTGAEENRITAEDKRLESERERIERTENATGAIRELDRRSGDLLQELKQAVGILSDNNGDF